MSIVNRIDCRTLRAQHKLHMSTEVTFTFFSLEFLEVEMFAIWPTEQQLSHLGSSELSSLLLSMEWYKMASTVLRYT